MVKAAPASRHTPIMILTALPDLNHKLRGFELGVDDYMVKPFDMHELLARIIAIQRRCSVAVECAKFTRM